MEGADAVQHVCVYFSTETPKAIAMSTQNILSYR